MVRLPNVVLCYILAEQAMMVGAEVLEAHDRQWIKRQLRLFFLLLSSVLLFRAIHLLISRARRSRYGIRRRVWHGLHFAKESSAPPLTTHPSRLTPSSCNPRYLLHVLLLASSARVHRVAQKESASCPGPEDSTWAQIDAAALKHAHLRLRVIFVCLQVASQSTCWKVWRHVPILSCEEEDLMMCELNTRVNDGQTCLRMASAKDTRFITDGIQSKPTLPPILFHPTDWVCVCARRGTSYYYDGESIVHPGDRPCIVLELPTTRSRFRVLTLAAAYVWMQPQHPYEFSRSSRNAFLLQQVGPWPTTSLGARGWPIALFHQQAWAAFIPLGYMLMQLATTPTSRLSIGST